MSCVTTIAASKLSRAEDPSPSGELLHDTEDLKAGEGFVKGIHHEKDM